MRDELGFFSQDKFTRFIEKDKTVLQISARQFHYQIAQSLQQKPDRYNVMVVISYREVSKIFEFFCFPIFLQIEETDENFETRNLLTTTQLLIKMITGFVFPLCLLFLSIVKLIFSPGANFYKN